MFLKEIFSVIAFSFVTLVFSGFAIKVDKFDYATLINDQLIIPIENGKKRKLRENDIFKYFEDGKAKSASIKKYGNLQDPKGIEYIKIGLNLGNNQESVVGGGGEIATIFPHSKPDQPKEHSPKIIKYFVETKSFGANFFC